MASDLFRQRTVLIVDDSPLIRQVVRDVIASSGDFEVAGAAEDGATALSMVRVLDPDVVTLDVQMPGLDGLATLEVLMRDLPRPVVMLSSRADGGDLTMRALELGAVDFVRKPSVGEALDLATLHARLLGALRVAAGARVGGPSTHPCTPTSVRRPASHGPTAPTHVVVCAASTGGPRALAELIPSLVRCSAAVVVAQHMPAGFTASLARRLDARSPLRVLEARDGDALLAGRVYVAPGGRQTTITAYRRGLQLTVGMASDGAGIAPSADRLFASAAETFGARCVATVLTGMGHDGARGAREVRAAGGCVMVQEPASCVVGGMPQAVLMHAGADVVAPLRELASAINGALAERGCIMPPT